MLIERVISAIIGIIFLIFFIFWGSIPFAILVLIISFLALKEYNNMLPHGNIKNYLLLSLFSLIVIIFTYLTNKGLIHFSNPLFSLLACFFIYHLIFENNRGFLHKLGLNLFGLIYIAGGMSFFILLRDFSLEPFTDTRALWLALIATWATDTGAYFIGRFFGKNKLAEGISPNKTIEGALGGIVICLLAVIIYVLILDCFSFYWLIYGILVSILAIIGDLFESSIKRDVGIKDFGSLIPGHGGILDRFDSLLFTIPFTFYFLNMLL